ncbi:MAG TPA: hypothetical protein HA306_09760 [Methanosarcina sp.]|nr:hypothetical protein [Methanosarcina sp.]
MDLIAIYKSNFTIFIGIFVTLAVMGTATLYDKHKSKGRNSPHLKESELFPGLTRSNSSKNFLKKAEAKLLNIKNILQKLSFNFRNKITSISSPLRRRNNHDREESISLYDHENTDPKFNVSYRVNSLDKVGESKKDEMDFDDDLLTKMSIASNFEGNVPEVKAAEPPFGEMSLEMDESFENDLKFDGSEFTIKVESLDSEPAEANFSFNENSAEIKFGEDSDNLLDSLKKEIVINHEKKINFMDRMQGEDLDLKSMKSDLEGILKYMKKYRQLAGQHN